MVEARVVAQRFVDVLGYEVESEWGTDLATTRLAIPGKIESAKLVAKQNKEAYRGVGSGYDPIGFFRKGYDLDLEIVYVVHDDSSTNSPLSLALGSAPDAGTGVITLYDATNLTNLRSFTVEVGYKHTANRYYTLLGCRMSRFQLEYKEHQIIASLKASVKDVPTPSAVRAVEAPALNTISPFDCFTDLAVTVTNPTIADVWPDNMRLVIENVLATGRHCNQASRGLGFCQLIGRNVYLEGEFIRTSAAFEDMFLADPSLAAADCDLQIVASKNACAQYIKATLTDAQILSDMGFEFGDRDENIKDNLRLQAKTYSFDVKA